jgi:uncharacterized membrane protein YfcA
MSGAVLFAVLVGFGVLTGATAGLLGVGGGLLIVPFLTLVADVPQHAAEATSLLVILPTSVVASLVLRKRGVGDLGTALRFGIYGALGGAAGALLALALSGHTLRVVFAFFVGLVGIRLVRDGLVAHAHRA